jgi:hypothetical protein
MAWAIPYHGSTGVSGTSLCGTPANQRVQVASFYLLDDAQVWYHHVELNSGRLSWDRFMQLINMHFSPPLVESPISELALLRRDGAIEEYCTKFMALLCRDPAISENHQVQLFTAGLDHQLRTDITLQNPTSLDEAIMYARAYAKCDTPRALPPPSAGRLMPRTYNRQPAVPTTSGQGMG